jgi:fructose/tagatose bisphosphate aldolase
VNTEISNKGLMLPARKNGYAIGAFNVQNLESMSAIAEAATEEKSPVIIPEDQYRKAISLGIAKINIDTDLRLAFTATVREVLASSPKEFDPRKAP